MTRPTFEAMDDDTPDEVAPDHYDWPNEGHVCVLEDEHNHGGQNVDPL